jgi:hypothetical protein
MERLQEFLKSDAEIFNELSGPAESPALMQHRVTGAKKLAARLPSLSSDEVRDLLALITQKIIINENNIQLMIRRTDLVELLEKGEQVIAAERLDKSRSVDSSDTICLTIETKRKRYGGEVHLVVPPNSNVSVSHPRSSLIKAVVRGHAWYGKVLEGKVVDLKSLAREAGVTPQYVRNIINCAFLAPDIVEAILEGHQPLTLKFANLYKPIPMNWAEQRRQFGFPQDSRSGKPLLH